MLLNSLQPMMAWAEDRATVRTDPSADPGAKIGGGAAARRPAPSLRDWHQSDKPSQQDAAISPTGCRSQLANLETTEFQFTVNQDIRLAGVYLSDDSPQATAIPRVSRESRKCI